MSDTAPENRPQPNRRPSPRRKPRSDCRVECRKGSMGLGPNLAVSLLDVSQSGIRLVVKGSFSKGDETEIVLTGTGGKPIKRSAVAVWTLELPDGSLAVGFRFRQALTFTEAQQVSKP